MEHGGMEWNGMEWYKFALPLFGYFRMEQSKATTPLFGKSTEWNEL